MFSLKRALSSTLLATGVLIMSVSAWQIIRLAGSGQLGMRILKLAKRLFSGIGTPEDLHVISAFILPILALVGMSVLLVMVGVDLKRHKSELGKISKFWTFIMLILIGLQLWQAVVLHIFDSIVIAPILVIILAFMCIQQKSSESAPIETVGQKKQILLKFFYSSLIFITLILVINFLLNLYRVNRYAGILLEF